MSESAQPTLEASMHEEPSVGQSLDVRTHYAHVRYAATETPGVIWYDPRDGHEKLSLGRGPSVDDLDADARILVGVTLYAKRSRCQLVSPDQEWVVEQHIAFRQEYQPLQLDADTEYRVGVASETQVFEDVYTARSWCREHIPEYDDAEYRNAVVARVEEVADSVE